MVGLVTSQQLAALKLPASSWLVTRPWLHVGCCLRFAGCGLRVAVAVELCGLHARIMKCLVHGLVCYSCTRPRLKCDGNTLVRAASVRVGHPPPRPAKITIQSERHTVGWERRRERRRRTEAMPNGWFRTNRGRENGAAGRAATRPTAASGSVFDSAGDASRCCTVPWIVRARPGPITRPPAKRGSRR